MFANKSKQHEFGKKLAFSSPTDEYLKIKYLSGQSMRVSDHNLDIYSYSSSVRWTEFMSMYQLRDKKPFFNTFEPVVFGFIFLKNTLLAVNPNIIRLQEKLDSLTEEEEDEIVLFDYFNPLKSSIEYNIWNGYVSVMKFSMVRDLTTLQINRVLEHLILPELSITAAKSLIKDMARSSTTKFAKYGYSLKYINTMFISTLKSQLLFYVSMFTFNTGFELYNLATQKKKDPENLSTKQEQVGVILGYQFIYCAKFWLLTGFGGVLGAIISPGLGTILGINIFPIVGSMLVDELLTPVRKKQE